MFTYTERKFIEKNCLDFSKGYAETTTKSGKTAIIQGNWNCGSHFSLWIVEDRKMACTRARLETIIAKLQTL